MTTTESMSRSSPRSSPHASSSRHGNLTSRSSVSRTPASVGVPVHTPLRTITLSTPSLAQQDGREASPNYFNLSVDPGASCQSSGVGIHTRANWSAPSSNVRSTAAISPRVIPLDQNPDFEEFRKQSEIRAAGFSSGFNASLSAAAPTPGSIGTENAHPRSSPARAIATPTIRNAVSQAESQVLEPKPRSPKRLLSSPYTNITDRPRRNSPAGFTDQDSLIAPHAARHLRDEEVRFSLPPTSSNSPVPQSSQLRSETLPATLTNDQSGDLKDAPPFTSPSHIVTLLDASSEDVLLLDLRVSTQYARSSIAGALNLCIPTTLLKRPSYNTQRLAETFKVEQQRKKFERWRNCKSIVVYDGSSTKPKDALACINMIKKFATEGWTGQSYIIRGGFQEFSKQFPYLARNNSVSSGSTESPSASSESSLSSIVPVIGGCPMPSTKSAANPFFGNIRQNMDLIGGVGQMAVKLPSFLGTQQQEQLPKWLREVADARDCGKLVSERFLQIEKAEQKRMQEALSSSVTYGTPGGVESAKPIQIAGIEKGVKNRYNNIWPYEHSRVRLEGVVDGGCDYVNANHIKAAWSNKRYVATQGPIPATFVDFWNVVWQQEIRVIVMLTAEKESGQIKAHNYWNQKRYGSLHLQFLSEHRASLEPSKIHRHRQERPAGNRRRSTNPLFGRTAPPSEVESPSSEQPYVIVRRFALSSDSEPFERMREITQLQYSHWPDFGAPAHPAHLLGLVEQCDAVVRATRAGSSSGPAPEDTHPVLVHCSAGCGRTGTFCTVDSVIDMLKRQRAAQKARQSQHRQPTPMDVDPISPSMGKATVMFGDDSIKSPSVFSGEPTEDESSDWVLGEGVDLIEKTVEDFRLQRLSMVQSLRQFVLCYESVLEWLAEQTPKSA